MRAADLSLSQWTGAWPEAVSGDQSTWRPPSQKYVPNAACEQVAEWLGNFRRLRDTLNQICAINAELLRRREDLE